MPVHPLLDAIMHSDVQPFRPFLAGNALLGLMRVTYLHLLCVIIGAFGAGPLIWRRERRALDSARER